MLKLWKYALSKVRKVPQNYNVIERAEKIMDNEKRVPPRHPGTEVKFQVLIKGNPRVKEELEKRDQELLDRLKIVKVTSKEFSEDGGKSKRSLPQERSHAEIPKFGFHEPSFIPAGKCSLRQALEFLTKHQNDPQTHTVEAIAKTYSMQPIDVENIIKYFRAFELYIGRESNKDVGQELIDTLGVGRIVRPLFRSKFAHLENKNFVEADASNKKK